MSIPINFPAGLSDEEIEKFIKEASNLLNQGTPNTVLIYSSLINLGQNELQRRMSNRSERNSSKATKITIIIAVISLVLSFAAIYFTYKSIRVDEQWKNSQIELLKQIRDKK